VLQGDAREAVSHPSTFSIVAADPSAGEVGVAVQSKFLAVGSLVPWARAGVGAVATQAFAEVTFGVRGLDLLERRLDPQSVIDLLVAEDSTPGQRQVGIVDAVGRSAAHTGSDCFEWAGHETGPGFSCQGNILAGPEFVAAMARAFRQSSGPLPERLLGALREGQAAGGDRRGQESAAIYVARPGGGYGGNHDRYLDLRVDHHEEPIEELARLADLHRLYFEAAPASEVIESDPELERELERMLRSLGRFDERSGLWESLSDYMGWENLEERWVGPGKIDPRVLEYLRDASRTALR
jgi:uncharacterized Ntn-hydrolase superfamily protein